MAVGAAFFDPDVEAVHAVRQGLALAQVARRRFYLPVSGHLLETALIYLGCVYEKFAGP